MSGSLLQALDFSGRRVLVTGGGRGIGRSIVEAFIQLNAEVIVLEMDASLIDKLQAELPAITAVQIDLREWEKLNDVISPLLPIHHLVNNAGVGAVKNFLEIDLDHVNTVMDINFRAVLKVSQIVAQGMIAHGVVNGTIVNISSTLDSSGGFGSGAAMYCASKAAVTMLTKMMALELAPNDIRVNCIRAGPCNTDLIKEHSEEIKQTSIASAIPRLILTHELIEPKEIAKGVAFLSSSFSAVVTGTALTIDSGFCIF